MLKKIFISSAILAVSTSITLANAAPYIGFSAGVRNNTANTTNYRGIPADLFVGFGSNMGQGVYLGGEVSGTLGSATITDNGLKTTYSYGMHFMPGLMINERTMGYLRLGMIRTRFTPRGVNSNSTTGGQFGLGLQTNLMQSWDLRGEYVYTAYSSVRGVAGSPRTDQFNLGLVYKFD